MKKILRSAFLFVLLGVRSFAQGDLGDKPEDSVVSVIFTTNAVDQSPLAPSATIDPADIYVLKGASDTPISSTDGITVTTSVNSIVGTNRADIDSSVNTGHVGFWTAGPETYFVFYAPDTETVAGVDLNVCIGWFTLGYYQTGAQTAAAVVASEVSPGLSLSEAMGDLWAVGVNEMNITRTGTDWYYELLEADQTTVRGTRVVLGDRSGTTWTPAP